MLGESLISWKVKKWGMISKFSAKAEYQSMAQTINEVVWISSLLRELGLASSGPTCIFYNIKTTIQIVVNLIFHENKTYKH